MRLGHRQHTRSTLLIVALTGALAVVLLGAPAHAAPEPPRPAFYEAPATLPARNGDLVRTEPMIFTLDPAGADRVIKTSTRVMYRSTDREGTPIAVTGSVLVPKAPWIGPGTRPVIGYAAGTQGLADRCAPSRQFSEGIEYEGPVMDGLLRRGYAIAMTDYQGLGTAGVHTYMDREAQGRAVLDIVRAAQRLPGSGLNAASPVGLQGYSQGGAGAASAAELAATYAPELAIKGASVGAVPADLAKVGTFLDGSPYAEFGLYAVKGLATSYRLDTTPYLNDLGVRKLDEVGGHCVFDLAQNAFLKTTSITRNAQTSAQLLATEPLRTIVAEQRIGVRKPRMPVLVTHSVLDDTVPYGQGRQMAKDWCARGADVRFSSNAIPSHIGGILGTASQMYAFFEARFAGLPQPGNCALL